MDGFFHSIPMAFLVILAGCTLLLFLWSRCSSRVVRRDNGSRKAYACGEEFEGHMIQPDYSQFFSFALFFTILHVVALMIATVPRETPEILSFAVLYLFGAVVGLLILLRK